MKRTVELGVIEFHSSKFNPGLTELFYRVVKDLRDSASIVDLWILDIAAVLQQFGYTLTVTTDKPKPRPPYVAAPFKPDEAPRFALGQKVTGAGWMKAYEITAMEFKPGAGWWYQVGGQGQWYGDLALCACDSYPPEPR